MGEILNKVRTQLDFDPGSMRMRLRARRMLEGGHTSLQFGRSDDFVDLREYAPGDDVRDIDWRASARSSHLVVRRYVAEKAQEFLLVADTGANLLGQAPSGESKRELAILTLGAVGLVACAQSDKISIVHGDSRGSSTEPGSTGEDHLEQILTLVSNADIQIGDASDTVRQLEFVAHNLDKRYAVYVVCDQPEVTRELIDAVTEVRQRNTLHWLILEDIDLLGRNVDIDEVIDTATGRTLLTPAALGPSVLAAYRRAEDERRAGWQSFTTQMGTPWARIASRADIAPALAMFTGSARRA